MSAKKKPSSESPPFKPAQCRDGRHYFDTDKRGRILSDVCRCKQYRRRKMQ